jgi:hypothetical protein
MRVETQLLGCRSGMRSVTPSMYGALVLASLGGWAWLLLAIGMVAYSRMPWVRLWRRFRGRCQRLANRGSHGACAVAPRRGDVAKMVRAHCGMGAYYRNPIIRDDRDSWMRAHMTVGLSHPDATAN